MLLDRHHVVGLFFVVVVSAYSSRRRPDVFPVIAMHRKCCQAYGNAQLDQTWLLS